MKHTSLNHIEFYSALSDGQIPTTCLPGCEWEQHLFLDLIPLLTMHPDYIHWFQSLSAIKAVGFRRGPDIPVVDTGINITRTECTSPTERFINSFMKEMALALKSKSHPYEEIFAVLLDGFYTFQLKHYKTLSTLH
ncbi:hypothetical protein ASESINO_23 [Erwinia phage vB_EamM_Asesino]|uniref:Uncharacterized protein n=1 Tax=Erwinia phage vB_EamM_Asesino TaxID=1883370 RepID=A0A1B2I9X8_9CAUD|nr:hypothetical protein ASESINO_23 [Erwinia phage vB_EamM_Asesino]ANZ48036.1 hypothetical protein ASESINO_23 [Erwinia phage vB_EamM_Asesino]